MKKPQHSSFKFSPIATAVAMAITSQLVGNVALAGSGIGSGMTTANAPVAVPTYYANSPSGPALVYVNGKLVPRTDALGALDGSGLNVVAPSGAMLRKFVDTLPGFGAANKNNLGQYIPVAVAEKWANPLVTVIDPVTGLPVPVVTTDDYYEIAAVEFRERLHSDLPVTGTHLRGYVQLETPANAATSKHIALTYLNGTAITDPAKVTATNPTGQVYAYDAPHHLGPVITAAKGTAVRVKFTNYLPTGAGGKLFVPVDTTITGAGFGPDGVTPYTQNRAGMHLVGGQAPWISAGSPHQWVAPAGEAAAYAAGIGKGASAQTLPDMLDPGAGSTYLYFPNDMSARFTFIQDRTTGLTRLNAYAGLEAAYVVTDPIEQTLITGGTLTGGALPAAGVTVSAVLPAANATIPLIIEDKTFVPANVTQQDALWTDPAWGTTGDLWFPHVYEPNQDPSMAAGGNPVGRWDYGPLFWPIFPVSSSKATRPTVSHVPEAYMDTPLVNGTAYPTLTVEPKAYRLRILNASNDRYINLGLYKADPTATLAPQLDQNGNPMVDAAGNQKFLTNTEVKMVPAAPINAVGNPVGWDTVKNVQTPLPQFAAAVDAAGNPLLPWNINAEPSGPTRAWPTDGRAGGAPDPATAGPDFVVIGNDGGLLPHAVDIPSQPVTYETNRRSITVLNIYGYGLLLGPSERADTIVDFSNYAGQTLIVYNDAPAPTPFNDPRNDYYTGNPDLSAQGGAYTTQPGYGPNTRTMMQIVVGSAVTSGGPLNPTALASALPAAYGASQPAPLVPEVAYNAAFGTADIDNFGHVATGSAAQPNLTFTHTGTLDLLNIQLVSSGGLGTGSGSGYTTPPQVVITPSNGQGIGATAVATVNAAQQVDSVTLTSKGSGYTAQPTVTFVSGNTLSGITVNDGGSAYTNPVTVTLSGGGLVTPTPIPATVTLSTASQISTTLPANWLVTGGSGYLVPPAVSFTGGGTGAVASATISSSPLITGGATVTNVGSGYTKPTPVVSAPQLAGGVKATASASVGYAVAPVTLATPIGAAFDQPAPPVGTGGGTTVINFSVPQLTGTPPVATVSLDPLSGAVTAINFTSFGSGYTAAPTATITDNLGNTATLAIPLNAASGQVLGVTILTAGSGYTAPATVTFTDATGSGAQATASLSGAAGSVTGLIITNGGGGYSGVPKAVFADQTPLSATHVAAVPADANVALVTATGAITGVTLPANYSTPFTSVPSVAFSSATGTGARATAGVGASGVGAQATMVTSTSSSIPVLTKAEQELFDDYGRYNSTAGVELPLTLVGIQTTIPLNYIDAPTEIIGDDEVQIWKLVDNGFWSNSIHFSMADVQLINRVGWDGTVKPPASNEVGWRDTLRLNPLEDVIVAVRAKPATVPFGQPRSTRLLDPTTKVGAPNPPVAPAALAAGVQYASGLGFTADPLVVTQAGTKNAAAVGVGKPLLTATANTSAVPGSPTNNFDNEFSWGSAILGHAENDLTRPVVFNPLVLTPSAPSNLADVSGVGTLTWTDPTPVGQLASAPGVLPVVQATLANPQNEQFFKVLQAPITNLASYTLGAWTPVATPFATVPANVVSYKEPAALVSPTPPGGLFYAYEVVAYNVAGDSTPSNIWYEAPPLAPTVGNGIPLLTPSFITPATTTSDVKLTLQWQDNAVNETNYIITKTGGPGATLDPVTKKVTGGIVTTLTAPANTLPPSTNTTFVDPAPLVEGAAYEYDVIARNVFGDSAPVLFDSLVAPISVPLVPTNVLATSTVATCAPTPIDAVTKTTVPVQCKPNDVVLTWTDNAFNETSYTVARTGGLVPFATVTLPASALNAAPATMTYKDATAQEGVAYTYTVSAINAVGATSAQGSVTVTPTAPTKPTNLVVAPSTAVDANGTYVDTATLTWSDNAYNEETYQVLRDGLPVGAAILSSPGSLAAANNPMGIATAGWTASPVLTYTDTGLADGTTHTWTVQATNAVGTTVSAPVTKTMPGIIIAPPSNLIATPNRAGSSIGLQWVDNSTNETDFLVEESVSATAGTPGSFSNWTVVQPIVTRTAAQTTATGGTVNFARANVPTTPGLVYSFRVSARNLANKSDSHPYLYGQANLQGPVLTAAPTLALAVSATGRVNLSWTAVAAPAGTTISYIVNVNGVAVNTNQLTYSYRPTLLDLQTGVNFTVQAVATAIRVPNPTMFGATNGPLSNLTSYKAALPAAPATPTGLAATIAPATGAVTLNWAAVTPATGTTISYLVSVNGATPVAMARGAALAVATGASYSVTVQSVATNLGLSTSSLVSAPITVDLTAAPVPNAPATLTVNATTLNWTAPTALAGTGSTGVTYTYTVQLSVDGGVTWTPLTLTPNTVRTLAALSPVGTNYQYRVAAQATRYGLATSVPSIWKTTAFNTAPALSTPPTAGLTTPGVRGITVTWNNASTNITGFTIQRRLAAGAWVAIAPTVSKTATGATFAYSFADTTMTAAGSYTYRLLATSAGGNAPATIAGAAITAPVATP